MAEITNEYGFQKPCEDDFYDVGVQNGNWDKADEILTQKMNADGGDVSESILKSVEESTEEFPVPNEGDSIKTAFGKVKKFIQDLKNWCLLVNEVRSILENLVECGYEVPNFLIKGLAVTEKLLQSKTDDLS